MSKIRIAMHSKTVGYSGTDRTCQLFCKYLAKSERFEPFLVYRSGDAANNRLDIVREWLGEDHVVPYEWVPGKKGRQSPYLPEHDNLHEVLMGINPDIMHIHRGGYKEWPGFRYMAPRAKWVETNIFGYVDRSPEPQMDVNIYISEWIRQRAREDGGNMGTVLYNPIEQPTVDVTPDNRMKAREALLDKYKLPRNAILLGRVGRADNFDPISLKAFAEIEKLYSHAHYLVVNPCENWHLMAARLGIMNIHFVPPIIDDHELSQFYLGLDIYAHARHDGECCPCNIQEAMMHGVPVVSHESAIYNGQSEVVGDAGFVVPLGDFQAYRDVLSELITNPEYFDDEAGHKVRLRQYFSRASRRRAMRHFEASCVTSSLEKIYDWVLHHA